MAGALEETCQTRKERESETRRPTTRANSIEYNNPMTPQNKTEGVRVEGTEEEEIGDMIEVEKRVEMAPQKKKAGRTLISKTPKENLKSVTDLSKTENKSEEVGEIMKCVLRAVEELKESNRELKAENEALRKEVGEMRVELKALAKPGLSQAWQAATSVPGLGQAWQAAPSTLKVPFPGTQETMAPRATLPGPLPRPQLGPTNKERGVTISLGKSAATLKGKPLAEIKDIAQKELQKSEATKGVKVVGVSAVVGERLEIQTGSKEQAEIARGSTEWTKAFGENAKVKQAAWYPIKIDGVFRADICKKTGNGWQLIAGIEDLINKSNSRPDLPVKVMKVY